MRRYRGTLTRWLLTGALVSTAIHTAQAQEPPDRPMPPPDEMIRLVRQPLPEPEPTPQAQPLPVPTPSAPTAPADTGGGTESRPAESAPGAGSTSTIGGTGTTAGASAATSNATDLGSLLQRSNDAQGVEVQQRNAVSIDPRIRGYRTGQYYTTADGGAFLPARLDLDSPISRFDPGSIRDVRVIRGPYTSLLGPGFAFLDIALQDTPRARNGEGLTYGGRSSLGYQTNGAQWNGLQAVQVGGEDWGFRGTYNLLQGNDYRDGDGNRIPASYLSHNINYGLGFDLTERSRLEFKGLRVHQSNLEFPGLYFDIRNMDTEAYSVRYSVLDLGVFDNVTLDMWYNTTVGEGDTRNFAKQSFVQSLLALSFSPGGINNPIYGPDNFLDRSTTRFGQRSIGYRLAGAWGNMVDEWSITAGTDLNVFGQGLVENIQIQQVGGQSLAGPNGALPLDLVQTQGIPNSQSVDPGLFFESFLPIDKRMRLRTGSRIDFVRTSSNPRRISGNIDLFGSPELTTPVPQFFDTTQSFDPILYSTFPGTPPGNQNLTRTFTLFSGFATAEYLVDENTTAFINYGYAERAPTLTELYAAGPFIGVLQQGTSRLIGDPNLSKERLHQIDAGLRLDYDWVEMGMTGFYALIQDYITYDANKLSDAGLTQVVYTNTDLATLAGTEMFVVAHVTEWLSPFATLSYVQGIDHTHADNRRPSNLASSRRDNPQTREFARQTEGLPQIPPMESRLGFRIHQACKTPRWQVEFMARVVDGQNNVAQSLNELTTPGFTTYNIRGFWQVNEGWLLTAGVENIGDLLYREHLDPVASTVLFNRLPNTAISPAVAPLYRPGVNFFFTSQLTY